MTNLTSRTAVISFRFMDGSVVRHLFTTRGGGHTAKYFRSVFQSVHKDLLETLHSSGFIPPGQGVEPGTSRSLGGSMVHVNIAFGAVNMDYTYISTRGSDIASQTQFFNLVLAHYEQALGRGWSLENSSVCQCLDGEALAS